MFTQLWRYAKAEKVEALENFSTEALAAAIRSDWLPFGGLLDWDPRLSGEDVTEVTVVTQKPVAGGFLDLAATFFGRDWSHEIWLEVKVDSGLHGNQIQTYLREIEAGSGTPTTLVLLTKHPVSEFPELRRLTWRAVRKAAETTTVPALWGELARYLEEVGVTDEFDNPIARDEAESLLPAAVLLRKMRRLLRRTAREARGRWPELEFPMKRAVADRFIEQQFADHGRLTIGTLGGRANVFMGLVQREGTIDWDAPEAQLAVWIEHHPKSTDVRRQLLEAAVGLDSRWLRNRKGYWALLRHEPVTPGVELAELADWFLAQLEELMAAGVLAALQALGGSTAEDELAAATDPESSTEFDHY